LIRLIIRSIVRFSDHVWGPFGPRGPWHSAKVPPLKTGLDTLHYNSWDLHKADCLTGGEAAKLMGWESIHNSIHSILKG